MLIGMESVAREIHFYTLFEVVYLTRSSEARDQLADILVKTYAKLFGFLAEAKGYYGEHTITRFAKAIFNEGRLMIFVIDLRNRLNVHLGGVDAMISSVDSERAHIEQNARVIDKQDSDENALSMSKSHQDLAQKLENWKVPLENIATDVSEISDHVRASERINILKWISPIPFASHHDRARDGRLTGTGQWLLNENAFGQWDSTELPPVLWLHGIPGAGKTKLTSLVVDHVNKSIEPSVDALVYFYCTRDTAEPERAEPGQILRCLARQLAYYQPSSTIRTDAVERYEAFTLGGTQARDLGIDDTLNLIAELAADLASLTVIIDALDECNDIPALLGHFGTIMGRHERVRLFLTSRDDKAMSEWLKTIPHQEILIGQNSGDIKSFVRSEFEKSPKLTQLFSGNVSPDLKDKVIQILTDGAQGMFRWVSLQLQRITGPGLNTEEDVLNALSEPLEGLVAVYGKIYEQINHSGSGSKALAERALKLLTCCLQPLSTTSFLAAISLPKEPRLDAGALGTLCCNLVVEDKELGIFRFSHQSVREYLEERLDYAVPDINAVAAQICLSYLTKPKLVGRFARGTVSTVPKNFDPLREGKHNLHDYAALFWPLHIQRAGNLRQSSEISALITSFLLRRRANPTFASWMKDARSLSRDIQWSRSAQTEIYWDLRNALDDCFCEPPNPWFVACVFGIPEVIENGIPPPRIMQNENGLRSLHLACSYRNSEVVQLLLSKGEDLDGKDVYGHTPLFHAVPDAKITQLLLDHNNDVEVSEEIILKVIRDSARSSEEEGIRLLEQLLKRGGEASITEDMIEYAASSGSGKLFAWLLDQDIDMEITQSVLRNAAMWSSTTVLRYLHELEPDLRATLDMLTATAANCFEEALEALLDMFDEPQIPVEVLRSAASNSTVKMLDIIFREDPDMEIPQDILQIVAKNRNHGARMTEYLLKRKPELDVTWDSLLCAAANTTSEQAVGVTKLLFAHDPTLDIKESVLRTAARYGNKDMLRCLLDHQPALQISQDLVDFAARNWIPGQGECAIDLLLERNPNAVVDMDLVIAAAARVNKPEFELLWNKSDRPKVTQDLLIAASSNYYPDILEFLLGKDLEIIPSEECFQNPLGGESLAAKQILDLLLRRSKDFVPSETTYSAAIEGNSETSVYFLGKFKTLAPTEQTWKNAACLDDENARGGCTVLRILWGRGLRPANMAALVESAARKGNVASVEFLLEQNAIEGMKERWLPIAQLMQATAERPTKIVQDLLDKGIEPDTKSDVDGRTPLLTAALLGREEVVVMLLETNAVDIETKEFEFGRTPLMCAAEQGHTEVVRLLLEKGADKCVTDAQGKTAFTLANESSLKNDVAEMLQ
jgi:ankyrin repeat protein